MHFQQFFLVALRFCPLNVATLVHLLQYTGPPTSVGCARENNGATQSHLVEELRHRGGQKWSARAAVNAVHYDAAVHAAHMMQLNMDLF